MKALLMLIVIFVSASNYAKAAETNDVDCPALNESSLEKGSQDNAAQDNVQDNATQE